MTAIGIRGQIKYLFHVYPATVALAAILYRPKETIPALDNRSRRSCRTYISANGTGGVVFPLAGKVIGRVEIQGIALLVVITLFCFSMVSVLLTTLAYMVSRSPAPTQQRRLFVVDEDIQLRPIHP